MSDPNIEEVYVYAEFSHFDQTNILKNANHVFLSDISSDRPKATIDKLEFAADYQVNLGSLLFFEKRGAQYELLGHTIKKLRFNISKVHHDVMSDNEQNHEDDSDREDEEEKDFDNGGDAKEMTPTLPHDTVAVATPISEETSTNNISFVEATNVAEL